MPVAAPRNPAAQPKPSRQQSAFPAPDPTVLSPGAATRVPESADSLDRRGHYVWLAGVGILAVPQVYQILQYFFR